MFVVEKRKASWYKGDKIIPTVNELLAYLKEGVTVEELWLHYNLEKPFLLKILAQKPEEYKAVKRYRKYEERLKSEPELAAKFNVFMELVEKRNGIPLMHDAKTLTGDSRSTYNFFTEKAKAQGYRFLTKKQSSEFLQAK